jgi:lipopolysaccharide biosynthesis glycosyltransferase
MPSDYSFGMPNGGLQVVNPSQATYDLIVAQLAKDATSEYEFADQSLLGDLFFGRWVALPYVYNALKTMRWRGVHDAIWRDNSVKNIHYILGPKPWEDGKSDETNAWWTKMDQERKDAERAQGIADGL